MIDLSFLSNKLAWLAVIPVLGVLVFWHELGHFLAALWMKVKVEEFGFGYPPRMATLFERKGIKFTLNWLPLGGFVRMVGEETGFDTEGSLTSKKPYQRAIVLLAGPLMNLILAPILYAVVFSSGVSYPLGKVEITTVVAGSPAEQAGILAGDQIVMVGDVRPTTTDAVRETIVQYRGRLMPIIVQRGDQTYSLSLTPRTVEETPTDQGAAGVGIQRALVTANGFGQAVTMGIQRSGEVVIMMITGLGELLRNVIAPAPDAPPMGGVAGPVGIARITGELARQGLLPLIELTAFLSLNFFIINLLPLPALDGGRLVFVLLEAIRRGKRIPPEREALVHLVGMMGLLALMLVISYFDLAAWWSGAPLFPAQ